MKIAELKKFIQRRPFEPLRFVLDAGEPLEVRHPEMIGVAGDWVMVSEEDGPAFFEAERVVSVKVLKEEKKRRS